jgi:hypothetical protein
MSETFDDQAGQPLPITTANSVDVAVKAAEDLRAMDLGDIAEEIEARIRLGERKYGSRLKSFNGRDAWRDAFDECLDCINYGRQVQIEGLDDGTLFDMAVELAEYIKYQMDSRSIHADGFLEVHHEDRNSN